MSEAASVSNWVQKTTQLAGEINGIKEQVRSAVAAGAVEIGKRLKAAKSLVPYGQWGEWLKDNVDYSERTAQTMMRLADEYGTRSMDLLEGMSVTQASLLLGLPSEDRRAFVEAHDMEAMSTREMELEIARLREENAKKQVTIEELMGGKPTNGRGNRRRKQRTESDFGFDHGA